ncbi:hypothetical protein [Oceanirhabdus sp. W0125-5]|uniref:hypothetical protein n=1 Tax=Oceanirhabdus sp. W0125-5 TaxID=2999116 RepID=UPI0022F301C6|nr:hypothetical protein [Oceanirhabdus sp. W0125-5]WBW99558.1 hypothetical protein OW730_12665 [Oceanirhabdus sp. W0125-5]
MKKLFISIFCMVILMFNANALTYAQVSESNEHISYSSYESGYVEVEINWGPEYQRWVEKTEVDINYPGLGWVYVRTVYTADTIKITGLEKGKTYTIRLRGYILPGDHEADIEDTFSVTAK